MQRETAPVARARRRPRWIPWTAAVTAFALFAALGTWQLQRAQEREAVVEAIRDGEQRAPAPLPVSRAEAEQRAWQPVWTEGHFLGDRQFLLDNRTVAGEVGFAILTPLRTPDDRLVLIERGWIAAEGREPARSIELESEGRIRVEGHLWLPEHGPRLLPALAEGEADWPRMTTRVDFAALGEALGEPLEPYVLRPQQALGPGLRVRSVEPRFGPERHIGYAFQWYALALTVLIVTAVLAVRIRRKG